MKTEPRHIETAIIPGQSKASYTPMYSMHRYWSKKPSEIIGTYIESYTSEGDTILDPFGGSGVTALEALRLGRKVVAIDLNPMATFMMRVALLAVNLPRMRWAFRDIQRKCEKPISDLYVTRCTRCADWATVTFITRHRSEPLQIAYECNCTSERQFKNPDDEDRLMDARHNELQVPYWYPENVVLPTTQKEDFKYVRELFTRRNLVGLSTILHAINHLEDETIRNVMRLTFTASLDKCSRLKPFSKPRRGRSPSLSELPRLQGGAARRISAASENSPHHDDTQCSSE